MAVKEWFRQSQPVQLYIILILTTLFFITELIISHLTHALTLLMDSYNVLCNIMVLCGCIATIKYNNSSSTASSEHSAINNTRISNADQTNKKNSQCSDKNTLKHTLNMEQKENRLRNTFGWARIDVVIMLICCVFLASLCFSVLIEALQTLIHIDHHDEMHHPVPVFCVAVIGLLLNGICYLLIGGYTSPDGNFLRVTKSGDVILDRVTSEPKNVNNCDISKTYDIKIQNSTKQPGELWKLTKDSIGCIIVMVCATVCYFIEEDIGKFVDPVFSLVSASILLILSYPYIKESCCILLQTIPDTIDIETLKMKLLKHFPGIISVHDLHIWELTADKIISTAHIIFLNPKVYGTITNQVTEFFLEQGITQVTIQPEFYTKSISAESLVSTKSGCLVRCQSEDCKTSHCCPNYDDNSPYQKKSSSSEIFQEDTSVSLKSVKTIDDNDQRPVESSSS
ncbi:zinc transporter 1 isoform X2 [Agrilus planipennis]|nr:zinc transporter 1 isoform X2 [Agrilus planipennis]XP_025831763.1 zinc transporter 1 isoform X2 [Agrilus planipennis]